MKHVWKLILVAVFSLNASAAFADTDMEPKPEPQPTEEPIIAPESSHEHGSDCGCTKGKGK